jgi:hypothetical protein
VSCHNWDYAIVPPYHRFPEAAHPGPAARIKKKPNAFSGFFLMSDAVPPEEIRKSGLMY